MKFNESLLKSKIKENLKGIENNLDREGKATAIAEALNFFDSKRDWVTKINRDEIISLVTNSPSQDVLCESIIEKVNATPFSKSLKESKKKKSESKKLNESLTKSLNEQKLEEGTSNFYDQDNIPLLIFLTDDEFYDIVDYDSEAPKYSDFDNDDDYYDAFDTFKDTFYNKYYKGVCILTEEDYDNLVADLNKFNSETRAFDYEDGEDTWTLEDIELKIEPGYYEGSQIYCENEKNFDYLSDNVKKEQLERFNSFLDEMQKKYGLTKLSVAYRMSNGETGYNIQEELKNIKEDASPINNSPLARRMGVKKLGKKNKKISYEDALAKLNSGDWDNERFNDAIMDGEVEIPKDESLKEAKDNIQTRAVKMMSVKKYYIDMAWKNGKTWKTDPMTLDEIAKSVDTDKVTEKQFVDMMSDNIKRRKDAKNLTKAEIVKLYDYMDGKWQGKDVLWSINDTKNESLNESEYVGNAKIITELPKINDQYGYKDHYVKEVTKLNTKDGYTTYEVVTQEKGSEDLGDTVDIAKWEVAIKENLKEGYYDYMDKDYADILDKDVDVYDIKQFVLNDTNNEFRTHYADEFALITCPNGKGCVVDYEAVGQDFDTLDSEIEFGIEENKDSEYTDENGTTHKTIRIFASHILTTTPKEVMEKAPKKTMKYRDFFRKYKYNDRCAKNFEELVSYIKKNGGLQENLKESYSIEQLASGETINDYKDNCKKYNIKITQLDGNNIKLEGRKEDLINYYKEVVGVSEDMVDLKEGCHSKKKRTLKEGYLGQTLEDFFYDCVDPEVIETVSLWGDDDEIYNGDYDGAIDEYGSNEFIEFDCGMDKVVINVDTSEEYQVTDYFIDVQDFVDCFNGDDIEVYDINTGETLFSGDRSELPDDVAEKIFVSFDAPKFISINIEENGDRFDDDDDFDESLKEALGKIQEVTKAVDCDGNEFHVKPIWKTDRLATLVDKDGKQTKVEIADLRQYYDLYDQDGDVISRYEDYMDESLKENNNTLKLQNGGFAYISDYNKDQFEKEYVETGKYKKSGVAQSPKGKYTLYTNSVGDTYAVLDENLKEGNNPLYRVVKDPKGNGYCILKRVNEKDKFINDHSKETFATPEEAKKMLDKVNELHFFIDENLKEDTVKQGDKWVNKGNTGETHGEFKTKKEADKQRKAMFVNKKPNAKWGK